MQKSGKIMRFIVLGFTQGLSSRAIIGRYKSEDELRDVFLTDRLSKAARKLYVFEVCRPEELYSCLWVVSFDVKLVRVRDPRRAGGKLYTKPSHIYTELKESMLTYLCGHVDASTYICGENYSKEVEAILLQETDKFKVESYPVKPWRSIDKEFTAEKIRAAIEWLQAKSIALAARVRDAKPKGFRQVEKKASKFLENLGVASKYAPKVMEKLKALGIDLDLIRIVEESRKRVEEALESRRESMAKKRRAR
jgi:hypothetical protein